jgi:hypothetical protein
MNLVACFPPAGAEVVRLYEALLGKEGFRKGMDLYFQRHDGQVRYNQAVLHSTVASPQQHFIAVASAAPRRPLRRASNPLLVLGNGIVLHLLPGCRP